MQLLSGPAGSGKSWLILERFREALRRADSGVVLLVPTATLAQHLQHRFAREGFVFRPSLISTLSRFIEPWTIDLPEISPAGFYLLVERIARTLDRPEFRGVAHMPGFCASLASAIEEISAAGCDAARLSRNIGSAPLGGAFVAICREVERELARRGEALRAGRLLRAAARLELERPAGIHTVLMDGFVALADPEMAVVAALARHAEIVATLPGHAIAEPARKRLLEMGFSEQICSHAPPGPVRELFVAANIEREADEIARRVLAAVESGGQFREIGVIIRNGAVYGPVFEAVFERFGIPARSYFDKALSENAAVRFLTGTVDALLSGWDHLQTLAVMKLAPCESTLGAMDRFDFNVRRGLPAAGLAGLRNYVNANDEHIPHLLDELAALSAWREESLAAADWAARLRTLRSLYRPRADFPAAVWRTHAAALDQFDAAAGEAARFLADEPPMPLASFWHSVKAALRLLPLRVPDRRRNVVHLLSAYEARQWELPAVFVCGLVEGQFPAYHRRDPLLPEEGRRDLQSAGVRVRTAADRELEEKFLFDSAVTRASESLVLSYPRADARGDLNLPSLFLSETGLTETVPSGAIRPVPRERGPAWRPASAIRSADLLPMPGLRFSPSSLESLVQCPFQFFSRNILHLQPPPAPPDDRLDFLTQGNIAHAAIAQWHATAGDPEQIFHRVFEEQCLKCAIPRTYRTEVLRLRLLADVVRFSEDKQFVPVEPALTEQKFEFQIAPGIVIAGRIDRLDRQPDGRVMIVDYKYTGKKVQEFVRDEGLLQAPVYAIAAREALGMEAASMYYCKVRDEVRYGPWKDISAAALEEARATIVRMAGAIAGGAIAPRPASLVKCGYCDFKDLCRVLEAAETVVAGGA